jgi:hypothetical protein
MAPSNKGTHALPHNPLTPLVTTKTPTAWTVRILRQELYANAQSVETRLGGGEHGHLGMLMPNNEYILISQGGAPYVYPNVPNVPVYNGPAAQRDQQKEDYRAACKTYYETRDLMAQLRQLMIEAIPDRYIGRLRHPRVNYANVHPREMLQHIITNYGTIKPKDLEANRERIKTPWNPDEPIEVVFINGEDCRHFAEEGGDPISDVNYIQILVSIFRQSGVMTDAVKDWTLKPLADQTVDNAIEHFSTRNEYHQDNKAYLKDTMTAHQAVTSPQPHTWEPDESLKGFYYCWTHGIATHRGVECKFPAEGHKPNATLKNVQGGSLHVFQRNPRGRGNNRGRGGPGRTQNQTRTGKRKIESEQSGN